MRSQTRSPPNRVCCGRISWPWHVLLELCQRFQGITALIVDNTSGSGGACAQSCSIVAGITPINFARNVTIVLHRCLRIFTLAGRDCCTANKTKTRGVRPLTCPFTDRLCSTCKASLFDFRPRFERDLSLAFSPPPSWHRPSRLRRPSPSARTTPKSGCMRLRSAGARRSWNAHRAAMRPAPRLISSAPIRSTPAAI